MLGELQTLLRYHVKKARRLTRSDGDRYLDWSIQIRVVAMDLESGVEALPDKPPLVQIGDEIRIGGWLDTLTGQIIDDETARAAELDECDPLVWHVGARHAGILLGEPTADDTTRGLLYSAEGGGKTHLLAQRGIVLLIRHAEAGVDGFAGCTAPTTKRLTALCNAIKACCPIDTTDDPSNGAWGRHYKADEVIRFASGFTFQLCTTKRQSEATGSPIQSHTWRFSLDDELQDTQANGADPDIEARLRGARMSQRMCTATAKDNPGWRTFRDEKKASPDWAIERLTFDESPFVWPEHWERMQRNMSAREWKRRGLAQDVGPERMVYTSWSRDHNVVEVPDIGWKDITRSRLGGRWDCLVGHDPGTLHDVSVILKLYRTPMGERWVVVDEVTTDNTTTEEHALKLARRLQDHWDCQLPGDDEGRALVRCDPQGQTDNKTDKQVYQVFRVCGFDIRSAAYTAKGSPRGHIPKQSRIDMVNGMFCNAKGHRRLFVCKSLTHKPHKLVVAIETSEYDESGKPESQRKDSRDVSHWLCALGYALWPYERLRNLDGIRQAEGLT